MGDIYSFFNGLYSEDLHNYLLGNLSPEQTRNDYLIFGGVAIVVTFVILAVFYRIIDKPNWNTKLAYYCYLLGVNGLINFLIPFVCLMTSWSNGYMYKINNQTNVEEALLISVGDIAGFAFATAIIASVLFWVGSLICNKFSKNCGNVPF